MHFRIVNIIEEFLYIIGKDCTIHYLAQTRRGPLNSIQLVCLPWEGLLLSVSHQKAVHLLSCEIIFGTFKLLSMVGLQELSFTIISRLNH